MPSRSSLNPPLDGRNPVERSAAKAGLQESIDQFVKDRRRIHVLEAGCGSCSHVTLPADAHLVGIDISEKQLERSQELTEKILGDLESYPLPASAFDLVICWYVLEHLANPERALDNMVRSLNPGGMLVLVLPNVFSLKGLVTKFTPHIFHVWFYRYLLGRKDSGTEDRGPFKTYLRTSVSARAIGRFAAMKGLTIVFYREFTGYMQRKVRKDYGLLDFVLAASKPLIRLLSFGKISVDSTEFIVALQKL